MTFPSPYCLSVGVESKLDNINQLKVKGLVLGPIHNVQKDQSITLNLQEIKPDLGTKDNLKAVLDRAHKKSRSSTRITYVGVNDSSSDLY